MTLPDPQLTPMAGLAVGSIALSGALGLGHCSLIALSADACLGLYCHDEEAKGAA
jgi:hypothetical protein